MVFLIGIDFDYYFEIFKVELFFNLFVDILVIIYIFVKIEKNVVGSLEW